MRGLLLPQKSAASVCSAWEMRRDVARCGEIWGDVARYGEIWGDIEGHVHRVVDEALLGVRDGQHALHPVHIRPTLLQELAQPALDELEIQISRQHLISISVPQLSP